MKPLSSRGFPSRLRRLDDALAALPLDEPMLVTELDGFLTGVIVSPVPISADEWLACVWGTDADGGGGAPFDDPIDAQWFVDAVTAQRDGIARDLARGKPKPVFDVDERNGDILWEFWLDGFDQAMALRPDAWAALAEGDDADAAEAVSRLSALLAIARGDSTLDSREINAAHDRAPAEIADVLLQLHAARLRNAGAGAVAVADDRAAKVGRNDPCRCGSGKKSKRCCG